MSCLDEEKHNLDVICFCFMLIYVILNCKCTKMIGSEAAGMEIDGRSSACMAAKREKKNIYKKTVNLLLNKTNTF